MVIVVNNTEKQKIMEYCNSSCYGECCIMSEIFDCKKFCDPHNWEKREDGLYEIELGYDPWYHRYNKED